MILKTNLIVYAQKHDPEGQYEGSLHMKHRRLQDPHSLAHWQLPKYPKRHDVKLTFL